MKIMLRPNIGKGVHRSGWSDVMRAVQTLSDDRGPLLDECVESSFLFGPMVQPHREPWVGIFHFPHDIDSPVDMDSQRNSAQALLRSPSFQTALPRMVRGIALTDHLATWLEAELGVTFTALKHPTETEVPQWTFEAFADRPTILQLGWHLRDTRAIFRIPSQLGWQYARVAMYQQYQRDRDKAISDAAGGECNGRVKEWARLPDVDYDATLARSIVLSRFCGVAAANVVVECIARGTPLLTNRMPGTVEYLGEDYCLYLDDSPTLDEPTILRASEQLIARRGPWMDCHAFAQRVREVCRCR
jgi:hypothetical protein